MRLLFLLFLLANIGAFAYIRYAESRAGASAHAQIQTLQISPEKLKLQKPANRVPDQGAQKSAALPVACLEWGSCAGDDVARVTTALAKLDLGDRVTQRDAAADSYWVHIPPFKTRAEADKKVIEVKTFGISDIYVMPDSDPFRFAISLGAFKTEDAANVFLAQIRQKGVRSAIIRPRGGTSSVFVIRDPGDAIAAKITELKVEFPNAALKASACSEPLTVKK